MARKNAKQMVDIEVTDTGLAYGYIIWKVRMENDYVSYDGPIRRASGFKAFDDADDAAIEACDRMFGKNGWEC